MNQKIRILFADGRRFDETDCKVQLLGCGAGIVSVMKDGMNRCFTVTNIVEYVVEDMEYEHTD